jgi:hypothetical protein
VNPVSSSESWSITNSMFGSGFGKVVASAGDVNGDGFDDLLVGDPDASPGQPQLGCFTLLTGGSGTPASSGGACASGTGFSFWRFGCSVSRAGDVNGDGYADVVVGACGGALSQGYAVAYAGAGSPPFQQIWQVTGSQNEQFGRDVNGGGDFNGDGYSDILVVGNVAARAYYGSASGLSTTASWTGPAANAEVVGGRQSRRLLGRGGRREGVPGLAERPAATAAWTAPSGSVQTAETSTAMGSRT